MGMFGDVGGWLGNNGNALTQLGIGLMSNRDPFQGAAAGFSAMAPVLEQNRKQQAMQGLLNSGPLAKLDPAMREYLGQDPEAAQAAYRQLVQQKLAALSPPKADPMTEHQRASIAIEQQRLKMAQDQFNAGQNRPDEFHQKQAWLKEAGILPDSPEGKQVLFGLKPAGAGDGGAKYGLNPLYGRNADGTPGVIQLGVDGTPIQPKLPDGFQLDIGLASQEKAAGKAIGDASGKAAANLPVVEESSDLMLRNIDDAVNDPNLDNVTGVNAILQGPSGYFPTLNPKNVTTEEKLLQIQGGAFLQAYERLKGAGQITEAEGGPATAALARVKNLRQDSAGYRKALADFRQEVVRLKVLAQKRAAGGGVTPAPSKPRLKYNAATGELE